VQGVVLRSAGDLFILPSLLMTFYEIITAVMNPQSED
jgi:hypothetical protein